MHQQQQQSCAGLAAAVDLMHANVQQQLSTCADSALHFFELVWVICSIAYAAVHHSSTEALTH
jgi:hypothetical protein